MVMLLIFFTQLFQVRRQEVRSRLLNILFIIIIHSPYLGLKIATIKTEAGGKDLQISGNHIVIRHILRNYTKGSFRHREHEGAIVSEIIAQISNIDDLESVSLSIKFPMHYYSRPGGRTKFRHGMPSEKRNYAKLYDFVEISPSDTQKLRKLKLKRLKIASEYDDGKQMRLSLLFGNKPLFSNFISRSIFDAWI